MEEVNINDNDSNNNHSDSSTYLFSPTTRVVAGVLEVLLSILGIFGNGLTILVVCWDRKLRENKTSWLIANLSISDLLMCSAIIPFYASTYFNGGWIYGMSFCKLLDMCSNAIGAVSIYGLLLITINRYVVIVRPAWYNRIYTSQSVVVQIIAVWVLMFALLSFPLVPVWETVVLDTRMGACVILDDRRNELERFVVYTLGQTLPTAVMIALYGGIFRQVRACQGKTKPLRPGNVSQETMPTVPRIEFSEGEIRLAQTMAVTILVLIVSYTPIVLINIFVLAYTNPEVFVIAEILVFSSATSNFLIYAVCQPQYRNAYKELLTRFCKLYRFKQYN